jgi:hypothetical protein
MGRPANNRKPAATAAASADDLYPNLIGGIASLVDMNDPLANQALAGLDSFVGALAGMSARQGMEEEPEAEPEETPAPRGRGRKTTAAAVEPEPEEAPAPRTRGRKPAPAPEPEPEEDEGETLLSDMPEFGSVEEAEEFLAERGLELHADFDTSGMPKGPRNKAAAIEFVTDIINDIAGVIIEAEGDRAVASGKTTVLLWLTEELENAGVELPKFRRGTDELVQVWKLAAEVYFARSEEPEA